MKNKTFNHWTLIEKDEAKSGNDIYWLCKCTCGTMRAVRLASVKRDISKSCGCINKLGVQKHMETKTRTFRSWSSMKDRCLNKNSDSYYLYGERGITICKAWVNDYAQFKKDMGVRPWRKSLDRIDNDGDYCPENCKWSTHLQQQMNKRNTIRVELDGKEYFLFEIAKKYNLTYQTVHWRYRKGWTIKRIVNTPVDKKRKPRIKSLN